MKKVLYIHELSSSGQTRVVSWLRAALGGAVEVVAPDFSLALPRALDEIEEAIRALAPDLVLGVSLGGFQLICSEAPLRLVVNPALNISEVMRHHLGRWPWSFPRQDGETHFELSLDIVKPYERAEGQLSLLLAEAEGFYALCASQDTIVQSYETLEELLPAGAVTYYEGGHYLSEQEIWEVVAPKIKDLLWG